MSKRKFVNRETFRREFPLRYSNYLSNRNTNKIGDVLYYQGDGGIGKSTLLEEFEKSLLSDRCIIKKFDFDIKDLKSPISFLIALRQAFSEEFDFPLFDFAYFAYTKRAHIQPDNRIKEIKPFAELMELLQALITQDVIEAWNRVRNIYSCLEQQNMRNKYEYDIDEIQRGSAKEIERNLVKYLAKDMEREILEKNPNTGVVIFLDTFEQVTSYSNNYIGNELVSTILDESDGLISNTPLIMYVIASRESCELGCLKQIPCESKGNELDIWEEDDAIKFITSNSNITDLEFCADLARGCKYYPFYLNLALDHIEHSLNGNYQEMNVENLNLTKMLEMFVKGLDESYRNTLVVLSCQNDWDIELFNQVVQSINWPTIRLELIREYSFIKPVPHKKDRITVHQIMRECIERQQDKQILLIQNEVHAALKTIYDYTQYDIGKIVKESLGESNLLDQYMYHSVWLIKNSGVKEQADEQYDKIFNEMKDLTERLKDSGSAKILLSPLEQLAGLSIWMYGENCEQYIDCHYQMAFVQTYSGNLHFAEQEDRTVYLAYKHKLEEELQRYSIDDRDLHRIRKFEDHMVKAHGSMAYDMCRNGKYLAAIKEGSMCFEYATEIWGSDSMDALPFQSNISYYHLKNGNNDKGIEIAEDVLKRREKILKKINMQVLISKRNLGVQYSRIDLKRALTLIEESYNGFNMHYGSQNGHTLESRQYFANFLIRDKQYDLAINHLIEVFAIRKEVDGEHHPNVIDCLTYLAFAYLGKSQTASFEQKQQLYDCAVENMEYACRLANAVFCNNESNWKIDMYAQVFEKLRDGQKVDELIFFLDTFSPFH